MLRDGGVSGVYRSYGISAISGLNVPPSRSTSYCEVGQYSWMAFWSQGRIFDAELNDPIRQNPVKLFPNPTTIRLPPVRMVTLNSES